MASSSSLAAFLVLLLAPSLGLLSPALGQRTSLHLPFVTENSVVTAEGANGRSSFEVLGHARVEITRVSSATLQPKEVSGLVYTLQPHQMILLVYPLQPKEVSRLVYPLQSKQGSLLISPLQPTVVSP